MLSCTDNAAKTLQICHLGVGQFFGERALVYSDGKGVRSANIRAGSTVVDVVYVDSTGFEGWSDFKMYLLMKEVRHLKCF
jgi:CRP-like cAMP-binding protein